MQNPRNLYTHNQLADFSSFGKWVTVAAPGVDIPAATANKDFDKGSGTSFACVIVTGVIALMLKANNKLTLDQVKNILKTTGQPVYDPRSGKMLDHLKQINAFEAIQAAIGLRG